jgi:hypothetical protein
MFELPLLTCELAAYGVFFSLSFFPFSSLKVRTLGQYRMFVLPLLTRELAAYGAVPTLERRVGTDR